MKLNRKVVMAFKNVGDAAHSPEVFHGTLGEGLEWMIQRVAALTIAKRFVFNIARNEAEALAGMEGRAGSKVDSGSMRLAALLASVTGEEDDEDDDSNQAQPSASGVAARDPRDDWQEV